MTANQLQPTAPLRYAFDDCLARFEGSTLALRTGRSDFRRNRTCEMPHLTTGRAFPAQRTLVLRMSKQSQRLARMVADFLQNAPEVI